MFGILRDICTMHLFGGTNKQFAVTPGTTPELRRRAVEQWADEHYPGDSEVTGRDVTITLLEYGYALHRLFEICPDALKDWQRG